MMNAIFRIILNVSSKDPAVVIIINPFERELVYCTLYIVLRTTQHAM